MFWTEIQTIVNKVVLDFGIDDNCKSEFNNDTDQEEIVEKIWQGRIWRRSTVTIEIIYNYDEIGLALRVTLHGVKN